MANSNHFDLKKLKEEYMIANMELMRIKSKAKQRELKEYIDDLKIEMGWTFLDNRAFKEGLGLFESLSWKKHGEAKCNGMARALTEMGHWQNHCARHPHHQSH